VGDKKRGNYFYVCILERIIWPISIKLGTNISCMMEIQVYSNEVQVLFKGGIITKVQK
jgi:hypothetical protein